MELCNLGHGAGYWPRRRRELNVQVKLDVVQSILVRGGISLCWKCSLFHFITCNLWVRKAGCRKLKPGNTQMWQRRPSHFRGQGPVGLHSIITHGTMNMGRCRQSIYGGRTKWIQSLESQKSRRLWCPSRSQNRALRQEQKTLAGMEYVFKKIPSPRNWWWTNSGMFGTEKACMLLLRHLQLC